MYQTVNNSDFHDAFRQMDRLENFSYEGRNALFEYLEQLEDDLGETVELDVIALCCDYSELTLEDIQREYGNYEGEEFEDMDQAVEWLQDRTTVIPVDDDTVIIQVF